MKRIIKYPLFLFVIILLQINAYAFRQNDDISINYTENTKSSQQNGNISGTVYAGENPLDEGDIYMLKVNNGNKSHFSASVRNHFTGGNFHFGNVEPGEYVFYVIPELNYDFLYYPKYLPTYFGETYLWTSATGRIMGKGSLNINLNLLSYMDPFYGNYEISGKLNFIDMSFAQDIPVPVLLLNQDSIPMDFRIVDKNTGTFRFEHLPEGTYYIHPEIAGVFSEDYKIVINENENIPDINFIVDGENVKIQQPEDENNSNPPVVTDDNLIKILLDDNTAMPVICELIDLTGKSVIKKMFSVNEIYLSTTGLATNIYILKIRTYNNNPVNTTKVFIRNY